MPMWVIVPHEAVAVGNSIAAEVVAVLPLVVNEPALRTYEPPETSVPVLASVGSLVNRPTYTVVGDVYAVFEKVCAKTFVSR